MTKREPFARVYEVNGRTFLEVGGITLRWNPRNFPILRAKEINDAHEKDVREAVEEFRKRAVALMRVHPCTASIYGSSEAARGAQTSAHYLASLVESLPTETDKED